MGTSGNAFSGMPSSGAKEDRSFLKGHDSLEEV
jgi:hypothetical protein